MLQYFLLLNVRNDDTYIKNKTTRSFVFIFDRKQLKISYTLTALVLLEWKYRKHTSKSGNRSYLCLFRDFQKIRKNRNEFSQLELYMGYVED